MLQGEFALMTLLSVTLTKAIVTKILNVHKNRTCITKQHIPHINFQNKFRITASISTTPSTYFRTSMS